MLNVSVPYAKRAALKKLAWAWLILLVLGMAWGLTFSLARIAATRGAHPLGITFWEGTLAAVLLIAIIAARRRSISMKPELIRLYLITGLIGVVVPGVIFFYAASRVPAGVLSISIAIVPILTFMMSAVYGLEKFALGRVAGVILGTVAIVLLVGPNESLPDPAQLPWVFLALAAAACYAALNMVLALMAPPGASSFMLTCGMFVAASLMMAPIILATDSFVPFAWPWRAIEWSLFGLGAIAAIAFSLYFYLIDHAGPVFGSLTANAVTLFGVIWGIIIFGEQNSIWIWLSLATMMVALALVTPRGKGSGQSIAEPV